MDNQNEQNNHEDIKHNSNKTNPWIIGGIIGLVILIVFGGLTWLYTGQLAGAKEKVFNILPLPAAIVDMKLVSAKESLDRIGLAKELAETQNLGEEIDPSQIYDQLIETKKLSALASKYKITITQAEIDEEYNNIVKQYAQGDAEKFKTELESSYKMSPEKFKSEVITQQLEQTKLTLWYSKNEELNKEAYNKAKDLKSKLDSGQNFDEVATKYTQDEGSKDFAGDSDMIPFDDLLPEFREQLADVKVGDIKLTASRYGLHIIKVLEQNNDGENGAKQIHLQQIFVKQTGFAEWLQSETDNLRVIKLLKF